MRVAVAAVLLLALLPATVSARQYELPAKAAPTIAKIKRHSSVPVLLPSRLHLDYDRSALFVTGGGSTRGWDLELAATSRCGGANACFLASLIAERGVALGTDGTAVTIAPGVSGRYRALSCGASCSPPSIAFVRAGVRYELQAKVVSGRRDLIAAARSSLAAGPR